MATSVVSVETLNLVTDPIGITCLVIFGIAYIVVMAEEEILMRKSKPVLIGAGLIWAIIGYTYVQAGMPDAAHEAWEHYFLEFGEIMLFLLVAMAYVNTLEERQVFNALRSWLIRRGWSLRQLFWLTGALAFCISPVADNLTTALLMCAVAMAVGGNRDDFIVAALVNIVVAANAGGAFSPFGDITTLMVWQKGLVEFKEFFALFIPSVVNWLVPAALMSLSVSNESPGSTEEAPVMMRRGAKRFMFLFLCTIAAAVTFHNVLHLPPVAGMMFGLGALKLFAWTLKLQGEHTHLPDFGGNLQPVSKYDSFKSIKRAEWDTLLFFYGVIMCVGGLGFLGYLEWLSEVAYTDYGPMTANIMVGILSSIFDNIPVMFAVLAMNPDMSHGHWLLVTLTAGVGGSMLSIGSAAGVALMGQSDHKYTFWKHIRYTPYIAMGYAASVWVHTWLNADLF